MKQVVEQADNCEQWLIEGIREEGGRFRPSDWVDRIAGLGACFGPDRRLRYSKGLQAVVFDGQRCLKVSQCLEQQNAGLYRTVMDFARLNHLRITRLDRASHAMAQAGTG